MWELSTKTPPVSSSEKTRFRNPTPLRTFGRSLLGHPLGCRMSSPLWGARLSPVLLCALSGSIGGTPRGWRDLQEGQSVPAPVGRVVGWRAGSLCRLLGWLRSCKPLFFFFLPLLLRSFRFSLCLPLSLVPLLPPYVSCGLSSAFFVGDGQ